MTDWEIWAVAARLRAEHGDLDGSVKAAMRADALLDAGDVEGYAVWIRVMACIPQFTRIEGETRH